MAGVVVEVVAEVAGAGSSLGTIVSKKGFTSSPSRIRKMLSRFFSKPLGAPSIPMEVLLTLSSLSCWSVSRRA